MIRSDFSLFKKKKISLADLYRMECRGSNLPWPASDFEFGLIYYSAWPALTIQCRFFLRTFNRHFTIWLKPLLHPSHTKKAAWNLRLYFDKMTKFKYNPWNFIHVHKHYRYALIIILNLYSMLFKCAPILNVGFHLSFRDFLFKR